LHVALLPIEIPGGFTINRLCEEEAKVNSCATISAIPQPNGRRRGKRGQAAGRPDYSVGKCSPVRRFFQFSIPVSVQLTNKVPAFHDGLKTHDQSGSQQVAEDRLIGNVPSLPGLSNVIVDIAIAKAI